MPFFLDHSSIDQIIPSISTSKKQFNVASSLVLRVRNPKYPIKINKVGESKFPASSKIIVGCSAARLLVVKQRIRIKSRNTCWSSKESSMGTGFLICHELCSHLQLCGSVTQIRSLCCPRQMGGPNLKASNVSRMMFYKGILLRETHLIKQFVLKPISIKQTVFLKPISIKQTVFFEIHLYQTNVFLKPISIKQMFAFWNPSLSNSFFWNTISIKQFVFWNPSLSNKCCSLRPISTQQFASPSLSNSLFFGTHLYQTNVCFLRPISIKQFFLKPISNVSMICFFPFFISHLLLLSWFRT